MTPPSAALLPGSLQSPPTGVIPAVACIVTEYRTPTHADVIVSKLLGGYTQPAPRDPSKFDFHRAARELSECPLPLDAAGRLRQPRVRVASLYTDQVPANDISREWSARSGVPIFPTIRDALTLGGERLAVDGVILIGEHGDYPENERGQQLYPRRRFFEETVAVFKESGRVVPVFNDKHIGYAWTDAKWMVDTARAMGFPFMAGSSLSTKPVAWHKPPTVPARGATIRQALVAGYGPLERYGFHALEVLQRMVERRPLANGSSGETGVAAVQCLSGAAVWQALDSGRTDPSLLEAALATIPDRTTGELSALVQEPHLFLVKYRDGLEASVYLLNGAIRDLAFAARGEDGGVARTVATWLAHHSQEPYGHFAWLLEHIQDMILTGREPFPVERTLLTTGILDRVMESHWRGGVRLDTPELSVEYEAS